MSRLSRPTACNVAINPSCALAGAASKSAFSCERQRAPARAFGDHSRTARATSCRRLGSNRARDSSPTCASGTRARGRAQGARRLRRPAGARSAHLRPLQGQECRSCLSSPRSAHRSLAPEVLATVASNIRHNLRLVLRGGGLHPGKSQPEIPQSVRTGGGGARGLMKVAQRLRRAAWKRGIPSTAPRASGER